MVITQEAARKRLNCMERLARAFVELDAAALMLQDMGEKSLAKRIDDCAQIVAVTKMQLREQISE